MRMISKAALVVTKDKKMLMVRNRSSSKIFYSLGGKVEQGESDINCIKREVREEVNCSVDPKSINFLKEFEEVADGKENTWLKLRMYSGILLGEPKPSSEVAEIGWFDSNSDPTTQSHIAKKEYLPWLKEHGYIN